MVAVKPVGATGTGGVIATAEADRLKNSIPQNVNAVVNRLSFMVFSIKFVCVW